jgi:hypothetical protein
MSANKDQIKPTVVDDEDVDDFVDNDINSDEQLGSFARLRSEFTNTKAYFHIVRDEDEAVDQDNIISDKGHSLRHAKPQTKNAYNEGPDEDDLPKEILEDTY